ncbi:MAG: hypothetical protein ABEN55_10605 [Bradymonadaceae bacterium]
MNARFRYTVATALGLLLTATALPATATEGDEPARSVGLGLDIALQPTARLSTLDLGALATLGGYPIGHARVGSLTGGLRIPVQIGEKWYLEPEVSGEYSRSQETHVDSGPLGGGDNSEPTERRVESRFVSLDVTLQFHRTFAIAESTRGYAGGRIGAGYWRRASSPLNSAAEETSLTDRDGHGTNVSIGPVVGAEHFLFPALSLGLEAHLVGRLHRTGHEQASEPSTGVTIAPGGSLILRTYF